MSFVWNSRGFSFEIEGDCNIQHTPVDCSVSFFNSSNIAATFGGLQKIEPDPDIAGIGVFVALIVQVCLIYVMAFLCYCLDLNSRYHREWQYSILFSLSDIMGVQAIVYIINFIITGKCTLTTYHYYVALNSVLLACSSLVLILVTARHHYYKTFAGPLRFIVTLASFVLLGIFIMYLAHKNREVKFPEMFPPYTRNDSAVLLPVSCFFDKDLVQRKNPYATEVNPPVLTDDQLNRMGPPIKTGYLPHITFYFFLLLFFIAGIFAQCCSRRRYKKAAKRADKFLKVFRVLTFVLCAFVNGFCIIQSGWLRGWVAASGWFANGGEGDMSTIGQIMAVGALVLFVVTIADHTPFCKGGRRTQTKEALLPTPKGAYSSVPQWRR